MRYMVTGSSGFVGSNLARYLLENGHEVVPFDIVNGKHQNILVEANIERTIKEYSPDAVFHTCGQVFLSPGEVDPINDLKLNGFGMLNLLHCLENENIPMVYTSTGAVYGLSELPHKEDLLPRPVCNYGVSKYLAELYLQKWVAIKGINAKIVRFSSVYGPNRYAGPVNIFLNQAREGKPITVFGTGGQTRDFVHMDDVSPALEIVLERGARGAVYNIGTGVETSVNQVARLIQEKFSYDGYFKIEHRRDKGSVYDLPRSWFDISKIQALGWKPRIDLETGIKMLMLDSQSKTGEDK